MEMRKLPRFVPGLRDWFSGRALIGFVLTGYNVLLSTIQIAPITESGLKWWLFGIGMALSLASWYALALSNARKAVDALKQEEAARGREEAARQRQEATIAFLAEFRGEVKEFRGEGREQYESMSQALERGFAAEVKEEQLLAAGKPRNDPAILALADTAAESWAMVVQMTAQRQRAQSAATQQTAAALAQLPGVNIAESRASILTDAKGQPLE